MSATATFSVCPSCTPAVTMSRGGCEHFNGVCTLIFQQVKGCRSLNRYRSGWLVFAADAGNVCPLGRWNPDQE